ncbi:hypothetical protein MLD38_036537 [Melastoma candidum]|uniref:Uncharacterized protein n=1 Tax=Melastoma candidum TaxID=119954 RepID=A0ACB9LKP5_9MYRT|nr:hypothetical protein MLD38_036537 [Melastoma candidum]
MPGMSSSTACRVAVIGAGAAGLAAARALILEGHDPVVLEREGRVGGTWVYTPETNSDPTGQDASRNAVHSSMYQSLRTNLPRELMGFRELPFLAGESWSGDARRFPGHEEVLRYLERFAEVFGIREVIRFGKEVVRAREDGDGRWRVAWRNCENAEEEEVFDAVVVCSGHFAVPRLANIPGVEQFRGKQIHSHNYRTPHPFRDQVVVVIGASSSAMDISQDILGFAREVHIACRAANIDPFGKQPGCSNLWVHPMVERICQDGNVLFLDGSSVHADVILHCTGYNYHFPFLETKGAVTVDEERVWPLYKHVFPPSYAPRLSFVGLIQKVLPFIQFELQSKWIAAALSGRVTLPSREDMNTNIQVFYARLEANGVPKHHTHSMHLNSEDMFEYYDWLACECGGKPIEEWRKRMWAKAAIIIQAPSRLSKPRDLRNVPEEYEAYEEFAGCSPDAAPTT